MNKYVVIGRGRYSENGPIKEEVVYGPTNREDADDFALQCNVTNADQLNNGKPEALSWEYWIKKEQ